MSRHLLRHIPLQSRRYFSANVRRSSTPNSAEPSTEPRWRQELNGLHDRVRIWSQVTASLLRQRADNLSTSATMTLQDVGGKLNQATGYYEIEALKKKVMDTESRITELRQAAKDAKVAYEQAVAQRSSCQKEVNDLLQRKSSWNDEDVLRFTSLVRQDHINEQTETSSKLTLAARETEVEQEFNELLRAILNRYHEEQIWSDKIRSASTYGSLLVLGVNVTVFVLAIVLVEPYKRKRLAKTFEKRIEEISQENKAMLGAAMANLSQNLEEQKTLISHIAASASGCRGCCKRIG
ncbi:sensitivity to high expression protein she9 [Tulasnella sp. 403]|nr:sensitivity to high expression protein she9 [Tulasnella sp. 403]